MYDHVSDTSVRYHSVQQSQLQKFAQCSFHITVWGSDKETGVRSWTDYIFKAATS